MSQKRELIWFKNPRTFIEKPFEFVPTSSMSLTQTLNSCVKLALYISIILVCMQKHEKGSLVLFVAIIFTVFIHQIHSVEKGSYQYKSNVNHVKPTNHNPFMNITLDEYSSSKSREIDNAYGDVYEDEEIKTKVNEAFDSALYQNTGDIFNKQNSQRQFYTMPVTTIPNKQVEFANWLYKTNGKTCKDGDTSKCTTFLSL
tara:strand:- start:1111 stop:1710 length:600 start_codon:yes stop_codon:yes gene_type:complete